MEVREAVKGLLTNWKELRKSVNFGGIFGGKIVFGACSAAKK